MAPRSDRTKSVLINQANCNQSISAQYHCNKNEISQFLTFWRKFYHKMPNSYFQMNYLVNVI